jgi:ribonucleoside-diphosphate reductase alpha chain
VAPVIRQRLPNRRLHEVIDFEHQGHRYTAGVGRFHDGRMAEILINASGRAGGMVEVLARDSAVMASVAFTIRC